MVLEQLTSRRAGCNELNTRLRPLSADDLWKKGVRGFKPAYGGVLSPTISVEKSL